MKRIIKATFVGVAEADAGNARVGVRKISCAFADLMGLGALDRSDLVIVDAHAGLVGMPSAAELRAALKGPVAEALCCGREFPVCSGADGVGSGLALIRRAAVGIEEDGRTGLTTSSIVGLLSGERKEDTAVRFRRLSAAGVALRSVMGHILESARAGALAVVVVPSGLGGGRGKDMDCLFASILPGISVTGRPGTGVCSGFAGASPLLSDFLAASDGFCRKGRGYVGFSPGPVTAAQGFISWHDWEHFPDEPRAALILEATASFRHGKALVVPFGLGSVVLIPEGVDVPGIAAHALACFAKAAAGEGPVMAGVSAAKTPRSGSLEAMLPRTREGMRRWNSEMGWDRNDRRRGAISSLKSLALTLDPLSGQRKESQSVKVVGCESAGFTKTVTGGALRALIKNKLRRPGLSPGLRDFLKVAQLAWKRSFFYD